MTPLLSLMSRAEAWPTQHPPVLLGLSILLLLALLILLPPSFPSHPGLHLLGSPWRPAVSQGGGLSQEGCTSGAQAHPPISSILQLHPTADMVGPAELHRGSFHLLPSLVHWEANMAIFIPAKCSCSCRQERNTLPGWEEGGKVGQVGGHHEVGWGSPSPPSPQCRTWGTQLTCSLVTAPFLSRQESWASCQDSQTLSLSLLGKSATSSPECSSGHWGPGVCKMPGWEQPTAGHCCLSAARTGPASACRLGPRQGPAAGALHEETSQ